MKKSSVTTIFLVLIVFAGASIAFAQTEEPGDPQEPITDPVPTTPTLNPTQMRRAEILATASGLSVEEIIQMRTATTTPVPSTPEDPAVPIEGSEPTTGTSQGRGWGVICKQLGLHPGILGNGTGDKFMPQPEEPIAGESVASEGLLARRSKMRSSRLFKNSRKSSPDDQSAIVPNAKEKKKKNGADKAMERGSKTTQAKERAVKRQNDKMKSGKSDNNRGGKNNDNKGKSSNKGGGKGKK